MNSALEPDPVFSGVGERGVELSQIIPGTRLEKLPTEVYGQIKNDVLGNRRVMIF